MTRKLLMLPCAVLACSAGYAGATDLALHLNGTAPMATTVVQYQCDAKAAAIGLPAGSFSVQYVNGAGNSLVLVPINGVSLIFANVSSGSGARYMAGPYVWWEAAGSVTLYSDSLSGKLQTVCQRAAVP